MDGIYISSSPHFSLSNTTQKIMLCVIISLLPECAAGIYFFGVKSLFLILSSVISCVFFEAVFQKLTGQKIIVSNLSAVVTGLLLALVCPPTLPLWTVIIGGAVAVIVAKGIFGGLGSNVFNPALTGRAFLVISFPSLMGASWLLPNFTRGTDAVSSATFDGITSATILSKIKHGTFELTDGIFQKLFTGERAGCIGETSVLLILVSLVFLLVLRIIDFRAPLAMCLSVFILTFASSITGGMNFTAASQSAVVSLMTGGLLFGAVFMVTDYATAPVTKAGRLLFGAGCGIITFLIRTFGGYPEGVMFSILIMNAVSPFLNNLTARKYGYGKKGSRRAPSPEEEKRFTSAVQEKTED